MFDKLVSFFSTKAVQDVGGVIDNLSTSDEEKSAAKAQLSQIVLTALNEATKAQADVLKVELQGNWLQRSWRPLVMLTFTVIIVIGAFHKIPYLTSDSPFWNLLELGLGGYVIGRSV